MPNKNLTKIIATLGPASDDPIMIEKLIEAGVNVFRLNTKHATIEWHQERIARIRLASEKLGTNVGVLIDLQGPEIRLETKNKQSYKFLEGDVVEIKPSFENEDVLFCIPHPLVFSSLSVGNVILIDDGNVSLKVVEISNDGIKAMMEEDGVISHRKGVNFPGVNIDLPSLIQTDLEMLDLATISVVDFIALSFSRTKKDIEILREQMNKRDIKALIVAKIESMTALEHLDELIEAADAVMVARGDLGVEVPIEQMAYWQKTIIKKCRLAKKPVITATQMLQSMIENSRPTRAEATDVANAVLDGTDALMLSGETASGKYPLKTVTFMSKIAHYNERFFGFNELTFEASSDTDLIIQAVQRILTQKSLKIAAIVVFTHSGLTAKSISRIRPKLPIYALTKDAKIVDELSLSYGVIGVRSDEDDNEFKITNPMITQLIDRGWITKGESVLVVHGQNYYVPGSTNALALIKV